MTAAADFADLLTDLVFVSPVASVDVYGKRTFGTQAGYQARVQYGATQVRVLSGDTITGAGKVYILGDPPITTRDRLVLPAPTGAPTGGDLPGPANLPGRLPGSGPQYGGRLVNILTVDRFHDETGVHHVRIVFGNGAA